MATDNMYRSSESEFDSDVESQSPECDLSLEYESSDFDVDHFSQEEGVLPYQFEPELDEEESDPTSPDPSADRLSTTDWCQCGRCHTMPTVAECRCCGEITQVSDIRDEVPNTRCITQHPGFQTVCLDIHVLRTAYTVYRQYVGHIPESPERYRYTAYRQFVRWCWGYLGKKVRVPLPSCAVQLIRETFPSQQMFTGFNYSGH